MEPKQQSLAPLTTATRQRLQKVFEHGQRCADKNDHAYANQLFSQCVAEDPDNLIYLQHFFANLQQKYGDNKKGAKFAGLKIKSHRSALTRSTGKGNWEAAFQSGCAALSLNPWNIPTLIAMARACDELACSECQLFYLRWAMNADAKHIEANRHAAIALERMGQFDQAIACWSRVDQAKPQDEEARQAVSRLSVEKTIAEGGYDQNLISGNLEDGENARLSEADFSKGAASNNQAEENLSPEERVVTAIRTDPTNLENYFQLADICVREYRFVDAEDVLGRGLSVSGGGEMRFRDRLEDVELRRAQHQVAIAEQRCRQLPTEETDQLAAKMREQANQVELEIYAARAQREPNNTRLQYELGLRLKRVGKIKDAIPAFQAARADSKRKTAILVELGECFQRIEQYKLALSNYEEALEACSEPDSETRRLALYRAGVLATGMKELDRAERHLTELAGLDYGYRDVSERLDKIARLRDIG